jgi:predicted negative regulator of RcsB-dependent stress response
MFKKHKTLIILAIVAAVATLGYNYYKRHPEKFSKSTE